MKDPRNNPDKWLRPNEPPSTEEIAAAIERLMASAVAVGRQREFDKACAEYDYLNGGR